MGTQIAVRLTDEQLAELDGAVAGGRYASRAAAVRAGVDRVLREERDRRLADQYRRAYAEQPQEGEVGEAGLALGADLIRSEEDDEHGSS